MESGSPKLLDRVRGAIRARHYSRRTEVAYLTWIRRYIGFHHIAHPATLGAADISAFLTWLATKRHVSASTQNLHDADLEEGVGRAVLPDALARKCPNAATDWGWQFLFPEYLPGSALGTALSLSPARIGGPKGIAAAVRRAGIAKHVGPHTFRSVSA